MLPVNLQPNIQIPNQPLNNEGNDIFVRVANVAFGFFQSISNVLVYTVLFFKDRLIDIFPVDIANYLDPRRIFVHAVLNIDQAQRAVVLQRSFSLLGYQIDPNAQANFIEVSNQFFRDTPMILFAMQNFTPEVYSNNSIEMINTVFLIPNDQREDVIRHAESIFTDRIDVLDKSRIITAIHKIPLEQRNICVESILEFLNNNMGSLDKVALIEEIASLHDQERITILTCAARFFTKFMNAQAKVSIIKAISTLTIHERENVSNNAYLLILENMDFQQKIDMINTVARVPFDQREAILDFAMQVIKPRMNFMERRNILNTSINIPFNERAEIFQHILRMYENPRILIQANRIVEHLNNLARLPVIQRANYVQNFLHNIERVLGRHIPGVNEEIEDRFRVHNLRREEQVLNAVLLIRNQQGKLSHDRIEQAIEEFINYLNNSLIYPAHK